MKNTSASKLCFLSLALTSLFGSTQADARGGAGSETAYYQELALGVAHPSLQNAVSENPAVLAHNGSAKLVIQDQIGSTSTFSPHTPSAYLLLGNGTVGGSIGYETQLSDGATGGTIQGGLGFNTSVLSAGFACSLDISGGVGANCNRFGAIFNPQGDFRVGAQLITGANPTYGLGIATNFSSEITFALDGTYSNQLGMIKPAIGFNTSKFFGQFGYSVSLLMYSGFTLEPGEFSAGLGMHLGRDSAINVSYKQVNQLYVGVLFSL